MHKISQTSTLLAFLLALTIVSYAQKVVPAKTPAPTIRTLSGIPAVNIYGGDTPPDLKPEQKPRWEAFVKIWTTLENGFFDRTFNGLDWKKVRETYKSKVIAAKSDREFHDLMQQMISQLGRSHLVIIPPEITSEIEKARITARQRRLERAARSAGTVAPSGDEEPEDEDFIDDSASRFGIGVQLRLDKGQFVISSVEKGSVAEYAGVKPGFIIDKVDGVTLSSILLRSMTSLSYIKNIQRYLPIQIVEKLLNGEKDTRVELSCIDGDGKVIDLDVRRELLRGETVVIGMNFPDQYLRFQADDLTENVGYIKFDGFSMPLLGRFCDAIERFSGKSALVIDLRGNTGGLIGVIDPLVGMLSKDEITVGTYLYRYSSEKLISRARAKRFDGRVVLLVDQYTMSAAEILAAGLQEQGRVLIVGERTGGEALPSVSIELPTKGYFMYPIADFKTRTGRSIEGQGVTPDHTISIDRATLLSGKDAALEKALSLVADGSKFPTGPIAEPKQEETEFTNAAPAAPPIAAKRIAPPPMRPPPPINSGRGTGIGSGLTNAVATKDEAAFKVVANFVTITGGVDAWKAVRSYSTDGVIKTGSQAIEQRVRTYRTDPNMYAVHINSPIVGEIRQIHSDKRYTIHTDLGSQTSATTPFSIAQADSFYPIREFVDPSSFKSAKYLGIFDRDGKKTHVIEVKSAYGDTLGLAFDTTTGLLISYAGMYGSVTYSDYRKAGDLLLPHKIETGSTFSILLSTISINVPIDEAVFRKKQHCFDIELKKEK